MPIAKGKPQKVEIKFSELTWLMFAKLFNDTKTIPWMACNMTNRLYKLLFLEMIVIRIQEYELSIHEHIQLDRFSVIFCI